MRTFLLRRNVDITGLSGTGVVAEGIEFTDGTVAVRWLADGVSEVNRERGVKPTTVMHPDIESVEALHGHAGATLIEWLDYVEPTAPANPADYEVVQPERGFDPVIVRHNANIAQVPGFRPPGHG